MSTIEQLIKNESNPECLREMALLIQNQNNLLAERNRLLEGRMATQEAERQEWISSLKSQLHKLKRRFFDKGRETLNRDRNRRDESEQLLMHAQSLAGPVTKAEARELPEEAIEHLEESVERLIVQAQKKDLGLTAEMAEVEAIDGFFETSAEITITERTYTKLIHRRQKYRVKNKETGKETIVTAPGPLKLFPGCRYSVDFALDVVAKKFMNHLPYERQRRDLKRLGLNTPVMTLYRLSEQVALHMEGVAEKVRYDIFAAPLAAHLDETKWPILSNHDDDGQMWVLSNQAGSYYRFEPTRSGSIADELLKGFTGAVLTDKYAGYLHLRECKNVTWALCWSHARREFMDLQAAYPDEVNNIVQLIDDLFEIERKAKTWDELGKLRAAESAAKLEEIKVALQEIQATFFDNDDMCKASAYVLTAWTEFTAFLKDVRIPLSNNDAERALRHAVLGRKNFNGSKTINGADTAATLYTIIESCKKVELDPVDYMKYVITENQGDREPLTPLAYAKKLRAH
jgi:transposase